MILSGRSLKSFVQFQIVSSTHILTLSAPQDIFWKTLRSSLRRAGLAGDEMAPLTIFNSAFPRGTNITFRHSQSGRVYKEQVEHGDATRTDIN